MDIYERMITASHRMKEYVKVQHRVDATQAMVTAARKSRDKSKEQLISEGRDLEKLDGITLLNLWLSVTDNKEERKRKEEEQYFSAKLMFDQASASLEGLEAELIKLKTELDAMGKPEIEYQEALQAKEAFLLRQGGTSVQHIFELAEELPALKAGASELEEAIQAGQTALTALAKVESSLGSAQGWGTFDILGGGLLTTAIKHSRINDARNGIQQAQAALRRFQREIAEVNSNFTIETAGLVTFADYFLDGLLVDVFVESKINTALNQTRKLERKVEMTVSELQNMLETNRQTVQQVIREKNQLVENAGNNPVLP